MGDVQADTLGIPITGAENPAEDRTANVVYLCIVLTWYNHISKSPVREFRTPGSVQELGGNPLFTAITDKIKNEEIEEIRKRQSGLRLDRTNEENEKTESVEASDGQP